MSLLILAWQKRNIYVSMDDHPPYNFYNFFSLEKEQAKNKNKQKGTTLGKY